MLTPSTRELGLRFWSEKKTEFPCIISCKLKTMKRRNSKKIIANNTRLKMIKEEEGNSDLQIHYSVVKLLYRISILLLLETL